MAAVLHLVLKESLGIGIIFFVWTWSWIRKIYISISITFNFKLSPHIITNVGRKIIDRVWTTKQFVKFNKLTLSTVRIFSEQGSVYITSHSKGYKTHERYNTYIKVSKTQFIKIIYANTSCILQCASALELNFYFFFINFYCIMEQISSLCSIRFWKYIHILHNNLHVTNYCYKLRYELRNSYMLICWLWWPSFILNVLTVCVFHVASGDKIQRNVHWLAGDRCLSLLSILLKSKYRCRAQVGLLKMALLTDNGDSANKYIYICIYIYTHINLYLVSSTMYVEGGVSIYDWSCDTKH